MKSTTLRRLNTFTIAFNALVALIPLVLLLLTLRLHGVWQNAVDAWRGEYVNPFFSQITNPWLDILPVGVGLLLGYGLCIGLAFKTIHTLPHSALFRYRRWIGPLILAIASAIFFVAVVLALMAHNAFDDFLLGGGFIIPPLIVIAMPLIHFAANLYFLRAMDYLWMSLTGRKIDVIERIRHAINNKMPAARETDAAEADLLAISFESTVNPSHAVWIYSYRRGQIGIDLEVRDRDGDWETDHDTLTVRTTDECLIAVENWLKQKP